MIYWLPALACRAGAIPKKWKLDDLISIVQRTLRLYHDLNTPASLVYFIKCHYLVWRSAIRVSFTHNILGKALTHHALESCISISAKVSGKLNCLPVP
jgi:hypothetical protein